MRTVSRFAPWCSIVACTALTGPAHAQDQSSPSILFEIKFDIDGDGRMDRAALVENAAGGSTDLYLYMPVGEGSAPAHKPSLIKEVITEGQPKGIESDSPGTLTVTSCSGCGAMKSWAETLTIVYRDGAFMVARYARDWDWNSHQADGSVATIIGSCDIDFLSGKGIASTDLDDGAPVDAKFAPVKLADWSYDNRPAVCEF